jgi:hypothetical protein
LPSRGWPSQQPPEIRQMDFQFAIFRITHCAGTSALHFTAS